MTHPAVRLLPKSGRRLRDGSPWAFSNEITMDPPTKALASGALVNLVGDDGVRFGTAIFNPHSLIAARLVSRTPDRLIDRSFFEERLRRAAAIRAQFLGGEHYRLIHAEGDFIPGLVIDRYGDLFVCQIGTTGIMDAADSLIDALVAVFGATTIIVKGDHMTAEREGIELPAPRIIGQVPASPLVYENGNGFVFDPVAGQKTGWFFDQRANRALTAKNARDARVLDLFCHTGGFGLTALAGGAREAVCVDSSETALAVVGESAARQKVRDRVSTMKADVFEALDAIAATPERRYEIVISDPPAFAKSRKDVEPAARAYQKLARQCAGVVAVGGTLCLASCSHHIDPARFADICRDGIRKSGRKARLLTTRGADMDHPVHPALPETAYLKFNIYALD